MITKNNVPIGRQELAVTHFKIKEGKVVFIFTPLSGNFNPIIRTFTQGSDALCRFLKVLTGKQLRVANESLCNQLKGKCVLGEIGQAKNPKYVDLLYVIKVLDDGLTSHYNNTPTPVIERESADIDSKKGGLANVGQTSTDLP